MKKLIQQYNEVAKKQRYFFNLISQNKLSNETQQEFEKRKYGLSDNEFIEMRETRNVADQIIKELINQGVEITADQIINGFEVI